MEDVMTLNPAECPGLVYFMPTPKSPTDATLTQAVSTLSVAENFLRSFLCFHSRKSKSYTDKSFEGDIAGIPVLNYKAALHGEVEKPGLGPCTTNLMPMVMLILRCLCRQKLSNGM